MDKDRRVQEAALYATDIQMRRTDLDVNIHIRGALHRVEETVERFKLLTEGVSTSDWQYYVSEIQPIVSAPNDKPEPSVGVPADGELEESFLPPSRYETESDPGERLPEVPRVPLEQFRGRRRTDVLHTVGTEAGKLLDEVGRLEGPSRRSTDEVVVDHD